MIFHHISIADKPFEIKLLTFYIGGVKSHICHTSADGSLGWRWEVRDDASSDVPQR